MTDGAAHVTSTLKEFESTEDIGAIWRSMAPSGAF